MKKKGFTLVEVIVSIILVSVVMVSLLASLMKLRETYNVIHENSDVIVYTSSIARVINNDLMKNNGIRYADCTLDGRTCELLLGNNEKRKLAIIEEVSEEESTKTWGSGRKDRTVHETIVTTLKYTNTTGLGSEEEGSLIYIRTLTLDKYSTYIKEEGEAEYLDVVTTNGYNFYDMNVPDPKLYYKTGSNYVDSISTLNIRIWDAKSSDSTKYDIVLYSSGRYDETELVGKTYKIALDTNGANESGTVEVDEVFGVAYFNSEKSHTSANVIRRITKPKKEDSEGNQMAFLGYYYYRGNGDAIGTQIIDSSGKIISSSRVFRNDITLIENIESLTEEQKLQYERVVALWTDCTNGYKVVNGECVPESYKVTLNPNGGTTTQNYYQASYKAIVPNILNSGLPTRRGFEFKGYYYGTTQYNDETGTGKVMYEYTEGIELKAEWESITFTVNYNANGGTGTVEPHECIYGENCNLAAGSGLSKEGYHFIGWKKDNTGETLAVGASIKNVVRNGSVTYYAVWEGNTYTASFNKNGATSIGADELSCTVTNGTSCTVIAPSITRSGYTIIGWNTSASATSGIAVNSDITLTSNATYHAITKINKTSYSLTMTNATTGTVVCIPSECNPAKVTASTTISSGSCSISGTTLKCSMQINYSKSSGINDIGTFLYLKVGNYTISSKKSSIVLNRSLSSCHKKINCSCSGGDSGCSCSSAISSDCSISARASSETISASGYSGFAIKPEEVGCMANWPGTTNCRYTSSYYTSSATANITFNVSVSSLPESIAVEGFTWNRGCSCASSTGRCSNINQCEKFRGTLQ